MNKIIKRFYNKEIKKEEIDQKEINRKHIEEQYEIMRQKAEEYSKFNARIVSENPLPIMDNKPV
jgi:hypothetical protein